MTIQTSKPFSACVVVTEQPRTGDARKFEAVLPYEVEGTNKTAFYRWDWKYSGTQEAVDLHAGRDGSAERRVRELQNFERHVEQDLRSRGERLYSVEGQS